MSSMIEYNIESPSLPFIGHKSGPSKWLEDLSRDMMPLKSLCRLESALYPFEDALIYDIIYPLQKSLISDRLLEELYKKEEYESKGKILLTKEQKDITTSIATPEITSFSPDLEKSALQETFLGIGKKILGEYGERAPEISIEKYPQRKLNIDLNEIEKAIPKDEKTKNKLVHKIIHRASEDIENVHIPENVKAVKEVLVHLYRKSTKSEKIVARKFLEEKKEDRSLNIKSSEFIDVIFEKIRNQFSKHIENIPESKEFLEKVSEVPAKIDDSNPPEEISLNFIEDYSVNKKESIDIVSKNQFSKPIEGISVSKEFLEKKSRVSLHSSAIHSENEASSITGSMQIDKRFTKDVNPIIREPKESISDSENIPAAFNTLPEQVYSNYKNKIIIHEDNKKLFLNLIEKINQSVTQNFSESPPPNQNIFNIHIREDFATSEKDLQNLSDRLVLILKEQARRHGIDLS